MAKSYKHSVLREFVTNDIANRICRCSSVPRVNSNGMPRDVFPVAAGAQHRTSGGAQCGLLNFEDRISEAKQEGLDLKITARIRKNEEKRPLVHTVQAGRPKKTETSRKVRHLRGERGTYARQEVRTEDQKDRGVPVHLRNSIQRFPFGNVHVMLMVGTVVIENGVRE